jgi:hypothetical protein
MSFPRGCHHEQPSRFGGKQDYRAGFLEVDAVESCAAMGLTLTLDPFVVLSELSNEAAERSTAGAPAR